MKVEIGVIAAAGSGTRMLPITLGYPKELLPIINKPAIQLIIEEFIAAGIKKIVIVTGDNPGPLRRKYQLRPSKIPPRGRYKALDDFVDLLAKIQLVIEPQVGAYGNGTPLLVAQKHISENEGFIYAYGDDILKTKKPFAQQLIELHNQTG